jgi:hypothetical protein
MKTNLMAASRQWAVRPADERFWTLQDLYAQTKLYAQQSKVKTLELSKCSVVPMTNKDDLYLQGPAGGQAQFQHYSFGQFCNVLGAPASYLRELPAELAATNLNHGLKHVGGEHALMFHQNGGLHLRCITGDGYQRIWNYEIAELALALEEQEGWRTPPARPCGLDNVPTRIATQEDVLRLSGHKMMGINVGDEISPAGLYASDHDCFIFQVNEDRPIDGGDGETLYRGVFWSNSEVGKAKFRATLFLYESVCGNHIVWGAKTLAEISIRHTGQAREMFSYAMATVRDRMDSQASEDSRRIQRAKQHVLGPAKDAIVTLVFGSGFGLSKRECEDAYVLAERHADTHGGDPNTAWGYASGVTRLSQQQYADKRDTMDRAAGKILEMAF